MRSRKPHEFAWNLRALRWVELRRGEKGRWSNDRGERAGYYV